MPDRVPQPSKTDLTYRALGQLALVVASMGSYQNVGIGGKSPGQCRGDEERAHRIGRHRSKKRTSCCSKRVEVEKESETETAVRG